MRVVDPRADRTGSLLRTYPAVKCFASLEEAMDEVDAVVIATPPSTHAPLALSAIAAGKHVMVEKPLATSVRDAAAIVDAAEQAGVVAMVGPHLRVPRRGVGAARHRHARATSATSTTSTPHG